MQIKITINLVTCLLLSMSIISCNNSNPGKPANDSTLNKHDTAKSINNMNMPLISIEEGNFDMGNNAGVNNEKPVHNIHLKSYSISKYEITVGQFKEFINATGYKTSADKEGFSNLWNGKEWVKQNGINWEFDANGNKHPESEYNHPVIHVSNEDATQYCVWMNYKTGKHFRLPTEAEWEFAAKGGNKSKNTIYSGSSNIEDIAWYNKNGNNISHPVGEKNANELGVCDMTGNVWEWCSDWYADEYYKNSPKENPVGTEKGKMKVLRGGSFSSEPNLCSSTFRYCFLPEDHYGNLGFRVVVDNK